MLTVGNVQLKNNLVFAPIAGFSEVGFRHLCAKYGAGLTYTELVSAKGLVYGNKGTEELLATTDIETPCAVQIFGSDPEFMYKAAKDDRLGKFDIIDINMGCPVKKVFGNGDGSALMKNPALITDVVQAVKEGGSRPVTVKMRAGIEIGKPLAVECALAAQKRRRECRNRSCEIPRAILQRRVRPYDNESSQRRSRYTRHSKRRYS